jgi:hypothetical protein
VPWILAQSARDVLAVHAPVPADALGPRLPAGVVPDLHDGSGWATVLAMRMTGVRPHWLPAVPGLSSFSQVAVRVFVRSAEADEGGVVFLALDVSQGLVAAIGRVALGLPFERAAVTVAEGRVTSGRVTAAWQTAGPAEDHPFFEERDILFAARGGRLTRGRVGHSAATFHEATWDGDVRTPLGSVGLAPAEPPIVRTTALLPSHVWWPTPVPAPS